MTGTADPDIAIGYIPRALNEITAYLREAANVRSPGKERALYSHAAEASCKALRQLASHDQLHHMCATGEFGGTRGFPALIHLSG